MGPTVVSKSLQQTIILRFVKYQKGAELIYTASEA